MSLYDTHSLYEFLHHTPESGLRKILRDNKNMTDVHCNLLFKIVKACTVDEFHEHFEKQTFPRIRCSPSEDKIKETFWASCINTLLDRGVLQPLSQKVAA